MRLRTFSHWPSRVSTPLYSCLESLSGAQTTVLPRTAPTWPPPWTKMTLWGHPSHHPDTPSMSDILRTHKTTSSWKLFTGNHFTTLCHDRGCALCATYMLHLTWGANAGELGPQPEGLKHALEEAWPEAIGCLRQDASQEVERANRTINRLEEELASRHHEEGWQQPFHKI